MILVFDQGTTSSRAVLFNHSGEVVHFAQKELKQYYPQASWVEHDPLEIWNAQIDVARRCISESGTSIEAIVALGIANQRETTVLWDRGSGEPIAPAIVWQDRRTSSRCQQLRDADLGPSITEKTGLVIDPYFCATKIEWLLDNVEGARRKAEEGRLAFGTIDSWLLWNLTEGQVHATDVTNASRTLLWNLHTRDWDDDLLNIFNIPRSLLPSVQSSISDFGKVATDLLGQPIAIGGVAGDQQAALMGQNCTTHGMAKNTYGTGCFALMNIGASPVHSESKLLTTAVCSTQLEPAFALEGSIFVAGAAVQWLRDELGIISSAAEVEQLAATVEDSDGVVLVPAFVGLGAPHWDAEARGGLLGITRGTNRAHIARAALEGIAYQVADVLATMQKDSEVEINELRVDGGAARNNLLMQFQADILGTRVLRPTSVETTAGGAGFLAGLSSGFWTDESDIDSIWKIDRAFEPTMSDDERQERLAVWSKAVGRCLHWQADQERT